MTDPIDRAAEVLIQHTRTSIEFCHCGWSDLGKSHAEHVARALDAAGLLVTPEHDRQVAAQALREWLATWPNRYVGSPIYEDGMAYADRIERGETDEDA